ncbi:hypothetical protein OUY22_27400 [Nonomuraea sp. MCN248]|uniref:Recombinase domain-containing protein n=1 Tax=Nonomuraea corallina TaxID=2989783 RepID=A0ABT4SJ30_9ACTN|nr:hypothetical protein [Nonomuraea corallina]MDA0637144.1 hypothetical protein [Nonomuraea corallina]
MAAVRPRHPVRQPRPRRRVEDFDWLTRFLLRPRLGANMRSAPIQAALEAVRAQLASGTAGGDRQPAASVLQRADESGEALAYWISRYGRAISKPMRRGIGDAILRLGNEFNGVKWDSEGKGITFADLLNLTHPGDGKGSSQAGRFQVPWRHDLFGYIVRKPHGKKHGHPRDARPAYPPSGIARTPGWRASSRS